MSTRSILIMVGVLSALVGAYWLMGRVQESVQEREQYARRLTKNEPNDFVSILVEQIGQSGVRGERSEDGDWKILDPFPYIEANPVVWGRLADAIAFVTNERTIEESPDDLSLYDMEPPHLKVEAKDSDGGVLNYIVGGTDPTQEYRYARAGDGPIVLITTGDYHELSRSLDDLRQRYVLPPTEDGIDRLELSRVYTGGRASDDPDWVEPEIGEESPPVIFARDEEYNWQMLEPVETRANQPRVQALVDEVRFMQRRDFIDAPEDLSDYRLDPPERILSVRGGPDGETRKLMLGGAAGESSGGGLFAKLDGVPSVFVIDAHIITLFPKTPDEFRETRLMSGEAANLAAVRYVDADSEIRMTNDEAAGWQMVQPPRDDLSHDAISSYLTLIKGTGGTSFPTELENAGFDDPTLTIELFYRGRAQPGRIVVGGIMPETSPPLYYVKQEDDAVSTIPLVLVQALRSTPFTFRSKRVFSFSTDRAAELDVTLDATKRVALKKVGDVWAVVEPADMKLASQADVDDLLELVSRARATGVAQPTLAAEVTGFDSPVVSMGIRLSGESATDELEEWGPLAIGKLKASESRSRFARIGGREEIFFVEQGMLDDIRAICEEWIVPR